MTLTDSAHTAKTQFHQFKFKHISGLKQGTGTVGVSTVGNQSQLTGTGSKFLADVKIGDEVVIYDTTGSFTSSVNEMTGISNRRGADNAVYENARNTTNDFMTFGNGTAGSAAVPNAANGGPWVIGEIIDYRGFSTGNNLNKTETILVED